MLIHMLETLRRDGHRMLVRDASHLGFPSCQILVPGMSEVFAPTGDLRKGLLDTIRAKEALRRFPSLGKEEQRELLAIKPHDPSHTRFRACLTCRSWAARCIRAGCVASCT